MERNLVELFYQKPYRSIRVHLVMCLLNYNMINFALEKKEQILLAKNDKNFNLGRKEAIYNL